MLKNKTINYIIFYESIFQCSPWLNSINLLHKQGFTINVYQPDYLTGKYNEDSSGLFFNIIKVKSFIVFDKFFLFIQKAFIIFKFLKLKRLSEFGFVLNNFYKSFSYISYFYLKSLKKCENNIFIGGDPTSLIAASIMSHGMKNSLVYWPLELWIKSDLKDIYTKSLKYFEKKIHKKAICTLEFGYQRRNLLCKENSIKPETFFVIPNSPIGNSCITRNYFFNDLFNIPYEKKIILHAGGYGDFNGIPQLLKISKQLQDNIVIVFHFKVKIDEAKIRKQFGLNESKNIYFSTIPLPFNRIDDVYSSCDIGLMLMQPNGSQFDTNLVYVDWSSGKLFNYLKFGVPVITMNLPGYKEMICENKAGEIINEIDEIFLAINKILNNENIYKKGSIQLFNDLKFEIFHSKFENLLINL